MTINETTLAEATNSMRLPQTPIDRQRKLRTNALLIVVTMIWGSSFLIVQHTLTLVGPFTFLAMRFGFAVLVLAFLFRKRLIHITYTEILTGSIIGLFLFVRTRFKQFHYNTRHPARLDSFQACMFRWSPYSQFHCSSKNRRWAEFWAFFFQCPD